MFEKKTAIDSRSGVGGEIIRFYDKFIVRGFRESRRIRKKTERINFVETKIILYKKLDYFVA